MAGPGPRFRRLADWLAWQETLHPNAIDLGLDRLQRTLDRLAWQRPACPVITVAGTNGKGSCVALTACILREAGYRVGTFTSPHLLRYNERIVVDGVEVSDAALMSAFERIDAARGEETLTFFEFKAATARRSAARRRASFARAGPRSSAPATCRHRFTSPHRRLGRTCSNLAATSTGNAAVRAGPGAGAPASSAICRRRHCTVRSNSTTHRRCLQRS